MKYLLDVNVLLAGIWSRHPKHPVTFTWLTARILCYVPSILQRPKATSMRHQSHINACC